MVEVGKLSCRTVRKLADFEL